MVAGLLPGQVKQLASSIGRLSGVGHPQPVLQPARAGPFDIRAAATVELIDERTGRAAVSLDRHR